MTESLLVDFPVDASGIQPGSPAVSIRICSAFDRVLVAACRDLFRRIPKRLRRGRGTAEDREVYLRDRVVCLLAVFPPDVAAGVHALWVRVAVDLPGHGLAGTSKERHRVIPTLFP